MTPELVLQGARVTLRPLHVGDAEAPMPPDLNDLVARAAYHRELRAVARPVFYLGLALALLALAAAAARH